MNPLDQDASEFSIALEILDIITKKGKATRQQIVDELWERGFIVYDPDEKEA